MACPDASYRPTGKLTYGCVAGNCVLTGRGETPPQRPRESALQPLWLLPFSPSVGALPFILFVIHGLPEEVQSGTPLQRPPRSACHHLRCLSGGSRPAPEERYCTFGSDFPSIAFRPSGAGLVAQDIVVVEDAGDKTHRLGTAGVAVLGFAVVFAEAQEGQGFP